MSSRTTETSGPASVAVPDVLVALGVVALGLFTVVDAHSIAVPLSANVVGPRVFPYAVGVALVLSGLAVAAGALRGQHAEPEPGEDVDVDAPTDWVTLAKVVAGFAVHVVLVDRLGWALAGALMFTIVAWAFGAPLARAAAAGLVLGFTIQAVFVSGLGVSLPAGVFSGVGLLDG